MAILFEMTNEYKEFLENEYDITFESGLVADVHKIKKTKGKEYKKIKKEIKNLISEKNYTQAKKLISEAKSILTEIEKEARTVRKAGFVDDVKYALVAALIAPPTVTGSKGADEYKHMLINYVKQENKYLDKTLKEIS